MNRFKSAFFSFFRHLAPAGREALQVAEAVGPELLAHPDWSDKERRDAVVAEVKYVVGENHPQFAWIVAAALDIAMNSIRGKLRKA